MAQARTSRGRRWLPWLLGGLALLLIACAAAAYIGIRLLGGFGLGTTAEDQLSTQDIERLMDSRLPPSASNIHSYYTGFQDYFAQVRFEIPAADLPQFLSSSPFTATLSTGSNPFQAGAHDPAWWRPYEAPRFQAGQVDKGSEHWTILVDISEPKRTIIYWQGFGT